MSTSRQSDSVPAVSGFVPRLGKVLTGGRLDSRTACPREGCSASDSDRVARIAKVVAETHRAPAFFQSAAVASAPHLPAESFANPAIPSVNSAPIPRFSATVADRSIGAPAAVDKLRERLAFCFGRQIECSKVRRSGPDWSLRKGSQVWGPPAQEGALPKSCGRPIITRRLARKWACWRPGGAVGARQSPGTFPGLPRQLVLVGGPVCSCGACRLALVPHPSTVSRS
jgi:hypothetical protein